MHLFLKFAFICIKAVRKRTSLRRLIPLYRCSLFLPHICRSVVASLVAVLVLSACTKEPDNPPNDQSDGILGTDNQIEADISAVRASNELSLEEQEKALLAILTKSQDLTKEKLVQYAKIAELLVIPVIAEIEEYEEQIEILDELIGHWIEVDLAVAKNLIKDLHVATLGEGLLGQSLITLAHQYPTEALRFSQEYHRDFGYVLESAVFHTIVEHNPQEALELLPNIRSTITHDWTSWLARDTYTTSEYHSVEFGASRPEKAAQYFYDLLVARICAEDPQFLIDLHEQISDAKIISSSARCLLLHRGQPRKVSKSQFDLLYERLIGRDLVAVDEYPKKSFIKEVEH